MFNQFVIFSADDSPPRKFTNFKKVFRFFISVYDAANAVKIILENNEKPYQIFNIAGDQSYSVLDLAKMVCNSFDKKIKFNNNIEFRRGDIRAPIVANIL